MVVNVVLQLHHALLWAAAVLIQLLVFVPAVALAVVDSLLNTVQLIVAVILILLLANALIVLLLPEIVF